MGKRKNRAPKICNTKSCSPLSNQSHILDQLRQDLYSTTIKQAKLIRLIRNEIPDANNAAARNLLQEFTDRLGHRNDQINQLIEGYLDRKITNYIKNQ